MRGATTQRRECLVLHQLRDETVRWPTASEALQCRLQGGRLRTQHLECCLTDERRVLQRRLEGGHIRAEDIDPGAGALAQAAEEVGAAVA
jgi:hypothetical protein